jgi:hypothetical protein
MKGRVAMKSAAKYLLPLICGLACVALARQPAQDPASQAKPAAVSSIHPAPMLLFHEEWKNNARDTVSYPVTQADLVDQKLELQLYGFKNGIWENHMEEHTFLWTGMCEANCALALRDKTNYLDLRGLARIRWRTKQNGFHLLRPIIELGDGTWLVGDHTDGYSADWRESEIILADVRWRALDVTKVVEAAASNAGPNFRGVNFTGWVDNPDLSKVDALGFTDLAPGSGHGGGGSSRVQWIEVYGTPVPRPAQSRR